MQLLSSLCTTQGFLHGMESNIQTVQANVKPGTQSNEGSMRKCTICGEPEKYALKADMDMEGIPICEKKECNEKARIKIWIYILQHEVND